MGRIGLQLMPQCPKYKISPLIMYCVVSTNLYLNQKSGKKQINVLNTYNLSDREFEDDQSKVCVYKALSVRW